jgi:outer membrane putative beta-barrel porin/alpha-amylase
MMHARILIVSFACAIAAFASPAAAQTQGDGPRAYWKTLAGANAVTFWPMFSSGNSNPLDPSHTVNPTASIDGMIALAGVHKVLPVYGRSSTLSLFLPVGHLQAQVTGIPTAPASSTLGFGDPMVQYTVNLAGGPALKTLAEMARYEPRYTIDLLGAIAIPIGEHDDAQPLNLGQGRWYGRVGAPIMYRVGRWVPGQRTTLEFVPAVWVFSENDSYRGTTTLTTSPLFQLEGHVTRDFTESLWGSFDASWFAGARPTIDGRDGSSLNNPGVGFTLGFKVTENLSLNTTYFSTVADSDATDFRGDEFRIMFTYGWHALIEGMHRLKD